jgi:hypothetical protein
MCPSAHPPLRPSVCLLQMRSADLPHRRDRAGGQPPGCKARVAGALRARADAQRQHGARQAALRPPRVLRPRAVAAGSARRQRRREPGRHAPAEWAFFSCAIRAWSVCLSGCLSGCLSVRLSVHPSVNCTHSCHCLHVRITAVRPMHLRTADLETWSAFLPCSAACAFLAGDASSSRCGESQSGRATLLICLSVCRRRADRYAVDGGAQGGDQGVARGSHAEAGGACASRPLEHLGRAKNAFFCMFCFGASLASGRLISPCVPRAPLLKWGSHHWRSCQTGSTRPIPACQTEASVPSWFQ